MAKSRKSVIGKKIRSTNARKESRHAKVKIPGGGSLPPGINSGIAKLTRVDFDPIKTGDYKGSPRFYAHGHCLEPKTFVDKDGTTHKTKGRLVQVGLITLADTKNYQGEPISFEQNVAKAEEKCKQLGFDTENMEDDFDVEVMEAFEEEGPFYFKFNTWQPEDSERVVVVLQGPAPEYEEDDDDDDDDDVEVAPKARSKKKSKAKPKHELEDDEDDDDDDDQDDDQDDDDDNDVADAEEIDKKELIALGKKADKGDEGAQLQIVDLAENNNIDPEDKEYDSVGWSGVIKDIIAAMEDASSDEPELVKGAIFGYKPPRGRKAKECEITRVLKRSETVNLKSLADDKIYEDVPWNELVEVG